MSENAFWALILCVGMTSCTACSISDQWAHLEATAQREMVVRTPQQECVRRAWTQADRMECLNGKRQDLTTDK